MFGFNSSLGASSRNESGTVRSVRSYCWLATSREGASARETSSKVTVATDPGGGGDLCRQVRVVGLVDRVQSELGVGTRQCGALVEEHTDLVGTNTLVDHEVLERRWGRARARTDIAEIGLIGEPDRVQIDLGEHEVVAVVGGIVLVRQVRDLEVLHRVQRRSGLGRRFVAGSAARGERGK